MSNIFGGVTAEQASAGLSALTCPRAHATAVPVDSLEGDVVAWLCPDCDRQLPADWKQALPVDPAMVAVLFAQTNDRLQHMTTEYKASTSKEKR